MGDVLPYLIPITALMIPIIAILTAHQRKMAELIHSKQAENVDAMKGQLIHMELEMQEMRDRLNAVAIDKDQTLPPSRDHLNIGG